MMEGLQFLVGWVEAVRLTYADLRMKNMTVSPEASWEKEWFLSGFPNLVVRSLAADGREVFQSGLAMAALLWWACAASPNCAVARNYSMASVGLL